MARIGENAFRQYRDGQDRLTAPEYMAERELIRLAVNDLDDKVQRTEGIREEFSNTVGEVEVVKEEIVQTKQEVETRIGEFSQTIDQTTQELQQAKEVVSQVSTQLHDKASKTEVQEVSVQLEGKVPKAKVSWVDPVNDFGADPTGTKDSYQSIMNAIQYMRQQNITLLKFPEINGTFILSKPVVFNIQNGTVDFGFNTFKQAPGFAQGSAPYMCLFFLGNQTPTYVNNMTITRGRFVDFTGDLSAKVIRGKYLNTLSLSELHFKNSTGESVFIAAASNVDINRVTVDGSQVHGISFDQTDETGLVSVSHWTVRNSTFKNCKYMGVDGHSAKNTIGRIENNTFINCSQLGKNESGIAVVKGNFFTWTEDFVYQSHADETSLYYGYNNDLEFTDNTFMLNGDKGHAKYIIAVLPSGAELKRPKIKGNKFIDKTLAKAWGGIMTVYSSGNPISDIEITDNYFETDNIENLFILLSNTERLKFEKNTCILGVTGLSTAGYYGLRSERKTKDITIKENTFEVKGDLKQKSFRIVMIDGTAEGYAKIDGNKISTEGLSNGTVYHTQFMRGTGYKLFSNNILTGVGTALLGTSVTQKDNYTLNAVISTYAD